MTNYKTFQIIAIVLFSMASNFGGRFLADSLNLPLWLDSFGTFFTAYCLGPFCGAVVGVSGNILHGLITPISFVYSITSIFIAVIVGLLAQKGYLETLLKTMSLSVLVTVVCVLISVVLNVSFFGGTVGNAWGDGVAELFAIWGVPKPVRIVLGQFYIDFLDKVFTLVALFAFIRFYRAVKPILPNFLKIKIEKNEDKKNSADIAKTLLLIFALLSVSNESQAFSKREYNSFAHTVYNKENGIYGGKANDIVSTNDGILWIGTYEGLYRHNGHEFRLMNELEPIKSVRCLYVDDEGRLFVGTNDNGLSIVINETVMNVIEEKDGLPADSVRSITRASNGLYYVGTAEDLAILSIADGLGIVATVPEIQTAVTVSADDSEHIAAVSSNGTLFLMNGEKVVWNSSEMSENFTACAFSFDGRLFASTESNKLLIFEIRENSAKNIEEIQCNNVRHINSIDFYDELLFLCADNGAGYVEDSVFCMLETGTFNNSIDNMTEDYQGNLWFTSSRLGLLKMCRSSFFDLYHHAGLPEAVVNSTAKFNGGIYFGTDIGLLAISENNGKILENDLTKTLSDTRIRCLLPAKDGSMWIATKSRGLIHAREDGKTAAFGENHQFRVVAELSDGTIVAGASDGIAFIKDGEFFQWILEKDGLENPMILSLCETPLGTILAGTDGGGLAIIQKSESAENPFKITNLIKRADGLSSNVVLRIANDFNGETFANACFVLTSNGLCYLDFFGKNGDISIKVLSNFPFSNNYDLIVRENKDIFILSSVGIFVVNRDELLSCEKLDYELLDLKKGLRSSLTANSWNYLDKNGDLYLSSDTGSFKINLNNYDKAEHSYRMQMKSVFIDGKRHIVQKDIPFVIPANAETLEIVPEIINYSINTPYISLFFEGMDETPTVMLQNNLSSMVYTNLRSGDYKFHIAVLDSKGRNIIEESVYVITKTYRIFDNMWFMFYIVGVAMLAIIWLTWFITSSIQGRLAEKQRNEMEAIKRQVEMGNQTIFSIANAVEARDKSTGRHSFRVARYAVLIARELGFSEEEQAQIYRTGLLHDIGKIGVPDSILNKPSRLSDEEYEIMKTHTTIGGEIMKDFTLIPHVDDGAKFHHEHYDGTGYPNGLKGEEIPLNARIIGIADAFDAMTANRVYRNALDMDFIKSELKRCAGTQFDPGLVKIMLCLIEDGRLNVEKTVEESAIPK